MARARKLGDFVYNYILDHFKTIHKQLNSPTVVKLDVPCYRNVSEIIRGVLEDPMFFDVDDYRGGGVRDKDQIVVSKNTIRSAIKRLIDDKQIAVVDGYWEYTPTPESKLNDIPLLGIASQTKITINVPESYIVLTVSNGLAASVAEYLSAQFYRGDIIFIPLGNNVICISTLPESMITGGKDKETSSDVSPAEKLRFRVTSVLHEFYLQYPQFSYGTNYETAYTAVHNPEMNAQIHKMAFDDEKKKFSYHRYIMLMKMFKSLPWIEEYKTLSSVFRTSNPDHKGVEDEEWELMDSDIMDVVDDELSDYA